MRRAMLMGLLATLGCGDDDPPPTCTGATAPPDLKRSFGDPARPVELLVPADYDPTCPTPFLLILHGYGVAATFQQLYFNSEALVESENVIVGAPWGTTDSLGKNFWNGSDACCDFDNTGIDHVAEITAFLDEVQAVYNIDPSRVFALGHSNGAFMSYRLACEAGDRVAGIIPLAGANMGDLSGCPNASHVSVAHLHGTADSTVEYAGGMDLLGNGGPAYPSASQSTDAWAEHNGCGTTRTETRRIDMDLTRGGEETRVETYDGCPAGVDVELWTIEGAGHIPSIITQGIWPIWDWAKAHPKVPR